MRSPLSLFRLFLIGRLPARRSAIRLVRTEGLEPSREISQGILSPLRLPFRHVRVSNFNSPAGARRMGQRGGASRYFDKIFPQDDCQSLPPASVTVPSLSKNLLGTWKIAIIVPPSGTTPRAGCPPDARRTRPGQLPARRPALP